MITDIELLSYIREAAQMGHDGIDTVLNYSLHAPHRRPPPAEGGIRRAVLLRHGTAQSPGQ